MSDKSISDNPSFAVNEINSMKTADEIESYIEGEKRPKVLNAARARMNELRLAGEVPEVRKHPVMLYHESEEPMTFDPEDDIPEGWNSENGKYWHLTPGGDHVRIKPSEKKK